MSENVVTWESLSDKERDLMLLIGAWHYVPSTEKQGVCNNLLAKGLLVYTPASQTLYPGKSYQLTPTGRALIPATHTQPDTVERLQVERKRLRDALKTVLRKANSLAGYYPESGDEREAYGMDAPIIFDDIRKVAREALELATAPADAAEGAE